MHCLVVVIRTVVASSGENLMTQKALASTDIKRTILLDRKCPIDWRLVLEEAEKSNSLASAFERDPPGAHAVIASRVLLPFLAN